MTKYDLIICGAGPAGLMAAATAASGGLKVLLLEKKRDITEVRRTDAAILYLKFIIPDEYIEPVTVEIGTGKNLAGAGEQKVPARLNFLGPGFSIRYTGPLVPYYNFINLSPSGHTVYSIRNELWGFYYSRAVILEELLRRVQETEAEVLTETLVTGAENTDDGVNVRARTPTGEVTFQGQRLLAADGVNSTVVESLGLNTGRRVFRAAKAVGWIMEGVRTEAGIPDWCSWISYNIPSVSPAGVMMGLYADRDNLDLRHIISPSEDAIERLVKHPRYASWFSRARLISKTAWSAYQRLPTIKNPIAGNTLIVSDAISQESWIQGAIACGYQAARATVKELDGKNGWKQYARWLHKAFAFFSYPDHFRMKAMHHILRGVYADEEIDYIYQALRDRTVHPPLAIFREPEVLREERPGLYEKVVRKITEVNRMAVTGWF